MQAHQTPTRPCTRRRACFVYALGLSGGLQTLTYSERPSVDKSRLLSLAVPSRQLQNIIVHLSPGTYSGQVTVTVHAANLTAPAKASLPVELVVEEASCAGLAAELVEAFKLPSSGFRLNLTTS